MVAGDLRAAQTRPWLKTNRRTILRALTPTLCLGLAWWLTATTLPLFFQIATVIYAAAHLALFFYRLYLKTVLHTPRPASLLWAAIGVDSIYGALLISQAPVLGNTVFPFYVLLVLRALASYRRLPVAPVVPFLFGPCYVFAYHLLIPMTAGTSLDLIIDWGLLLSSLGIGSVAIWVSASQYQVTNALRQELRTERAGHDARIIDLERSANDLRARMRQLHALEEGLRVITSTLSLDEVLNQIVDSTVQMLGSARIYGLALSLEQGEEFDHRLFIFEEGTTLTWATSLTRRAIEQQVPLIITDTTHDEELATIIPAGVRSVLCVPLFVGDGPAQGALTVVGLAPGAFSSTDARHLTALAMQAGIAIHNAEMHSRLRQQQRLFEAVVRDINDGLVVVDSRSQIVLANPIGHSLLQSEINDQPVHEQLLALANNIRSDGHAILTSELHLQESDAEAERIFQAFGSQVRHEESEEPLIAILLRDITAQKEEERSRTDFISMVSHELRNPLNSLNGFIKVVLRGQAGALTALQQEFLGIADGQVEQLKSRISELLEYNRVEAGRLVLDPKLNDLSLLVNGTATRLALQAEQNNLTLINEVEPNLPECSFDSERIGQVLNNLIENAIKATPAGGTITLRSELYDDEVWVRVYDTGVGIPAEEQSKIFQRFYRAHNRHSSKGNHLGLGLTICQQIIVGHHGRLWVESEHGQGSCFTFALPLAPREEFAGEAV